MNLTINIKFRHYFVALFKRQTMALNSLVFADAPLTPHSSQLPPSSYTVTIRLRKGSYLGLEFSYSDHQTLEIIRMTILLIQKLK